MNNYKLSDTLILKNRIVMAPMTRRVADNYHNPTPIMGDYYARRAGCGLIITEGTLISQDAIGYGNVPGIFSNKQIDEWSSITNKIHKNHGLVFLQLWHCGRISNSVFHNGCLPIAPSETHLNIPLGKTGLTCSESRAASVAEIQELIATYALAAKNAILAGFDGVEIHGANGYLIDQFLHYCSNQRTDNYGQTPENMARFCLEVVDACGSAIGFDRIGLRLSPGGHMNEIQTMSADQKVFIYLLTQLNQYKIAYIHTGAFDDSITYEGLGNINMTNFMRKYYSGTLIAAGGYDITSATDGINNNFFDLVAMGRSFIANSDLIDKLKQNQELKLYKPEYLSQKLY